MAEGCMFCDIIDGKAPAKVIDAGPDVFVIEPLNPVTPGHLLVIPRRHVIDALEEPTVTGIAMFEAARHAERPCNIITNAGAEASQTVFHLHIHIVPRRADDGLKLPWTDGG